MICGASAAREQLHGEMGGRAIALRGVAQCAGTSRVQSDRGTVLGRQILLDRKDIGAERQDRHRLELGGIVAEGLEQRGVGGASVLGGVASSVPAVRRRRVTTASLAMLPLPPVRFSTVTVRPQSCCR